MDLAHTQLRRILAERNLTTARAAVLLGCSATYLSRVLRGEHVPTDPFRFRAEQKFGVQASTWDPRSLDRDILIRAGWRPIRLARKLGLAPSLVLCWWRGGQCAAVADAVAPLLEAAS
jgi:hypothetical protein